MAKSKNCKKASHRKDATAARLTTLRNKIAKFETIVRKNPNDHCALNTLTQARYDYANFGRK